MITFKDFCGHIPIALMISLYEDGLVSEEYISELAEEGILESYMTEISKGMGAVLGYGSKGLLGAIIGYMVSPGKIKSKEDKITKAKEMIEAKLKLAAIRASEKEDPEKKAKIMDKAKKEADKLKKKIEELKIDILKLQAKGKGGPGMLYKILQKKYGDFE